MTKLKPGDDAPDFDLSDAEGKRWKLSNLRGQKVILYFYPADDTPGCTREACDFRDSQAVFQNEGYVVLGVSPQDATSHEQFSNKYSLNFPLLIDEDLSVADAYGARAGGEYEYKGIPLHVARSTFVIDADGRIQSAMYGVRSKGHVEELRKELVSG